MQTEMPTILEVKNLKKTFGKKEKITALDHVSFQIRQGECFGLVGESGSGKSTLGRMLASLEKPDEGTILFKRKPLSEWKKQEKYLFYRHVQMVYQNPWSAFSPRMTMQEFLIQGRVNFRLMTRQCALGMVREVLEQIGLPDQYRSRLPHELSGGELQRIVIARALSVNPDVIVFDEATSALDVSIQRSIMEYLVKVQRERGFTSLFIGHDIAVVRSVSHRIGILFQGKMVEILESEKLVSEHRHPYTEALLNVSFTLHSRYEEKQADRERTETIGGKPENGCTYAPRCPYVHSRCLEEEPQLEEMAKGHWVACHLRFPVLGVAL